ncbi:MAG: polyhydroxyalkanoic acid system family protein [Deltaproteobacteria bacterium]|nr:polyhydroxyalkanoic acid system family protein [Deltaproteobacteria bacterium]
MPNLKLSRPHSFPLDEAAGKLRSLMDFVQSDLARFIDKVEWAPDGRSARVRGALFKGRFAINSTALNIELNVSILATLFMEKIRTRIESTLDQHFSPARPSATSSPQ